MMTCDEASSFEIVTYCSLGFRNALALTLPSWIKNSGAARITVYSDQELPAPEGAIHRRFFEQPAEDGPTSWLRKIVALQDTITHPEAHRFCWLDADVYCTGPFGEAFERMGSCDIAATRMFNNTSRGAGALNAGVLFFRDTPATMRFLLEWSARANELKGARGWFEQRAASDLLHQAFHGLKNYHVAPLSENLYNLEDDCIDAWFQRIELYKPKLIHFKRRWWQRPELVDRVLQMTG